MSFTPPSRLASATGQASPGALPHSLLNFHLEYAIFIPTEIRDWMLVEKMNSALIESEMILPDCSASKVVRHPTLKPTSAASVRLITPVTVMEHSPAVGFLRRRAKPSLR
jgi:hypothetical protein